MSDPAIEVHQLVREFRKGPRAVDGIDLAVQPGEIYGFLGPNGAGKSTTVLMLTTLLPPTSGSASVGGYDIVRQGGQVRETIGAALQEAALDSILTGREHLMLQATLQGIPSRDRKTRAQELLERVGLTEAADRRVGGYSGGMKRRLDLALALMHSPQILFLDEPTTGLDPQSRAALWEEVSRLARDDGMTVFLTTQYLEEADALADRIGIIDQGTIVAEGTPTQLKAEIGSPSVEVAPSDEHDSDTLAELLSRFGEPKRGARGRVTVQLPGGETELAEIVRLLDQNNLHVETLAAPPALPRRRVPREDGPQARGSRRRVTRQTSLIEQVGAVARRSAVAVLRQRALIIFPMLFPLILFAINGSSLSRVTELPGFPTHSYRAFLLAFPFVQGAMFVSISTGTAIARDVETGFLNRLALTPLRSDAMLFGQLGGAFVLGCVQAVVYLLVGLATGVDFVSGVGGVLVLLALSLSISFAFASLGGLLALRLGTRRSDPGHLPAAVRAAVPELGHAAAQPDRHRVVPRNRHLQPDLLPGRGAAQPRDPGLERAGARARVRALVGARGDLARARARCDEVEARAGMRRFLFVTRAVAWRSIHNTLVNPAILVPSIIFPLFFLVAFAGGLSRVSDVPNFHYGPGYTAFQFTFVFLQSAAFGGVFTGFAVARDFESGLRAPAAAGRAAPQRDHRRLRRGRVPALAGRRRPS